MAKTYYITTPYGGTRAKIWYKKPSIPCVQVTEIPSGLGELHFINGVLVRRPFSNIPQETVDTEKEIMKAQISAQSDRIEFLEDCIAEMAMQVYGDG